MASLPGNSLGMKLTILFLRCCGCWAEDTEFRKRLMDWVLIYSIGTLVFALTVTCTDLYMCYGDFDKFTYCSLNVCTVGYGLFKVIVFASKRQLLLELISYAKVNFWFVTYNNYGAKVMQQCMRRCAFMIIFTVFMCHVALVIHYIKPLIANRGKNASDRVLPFKLYVDLPLSLSPWYEILYVIETFSGLHCCICYFCFDNFLCTLNITLLGQFLILHKDIRVIYNESSESLLGNENYTRRSFVKCVQQHQKLINFTEDVKEVFREIILGTVILLSFLLCLELYQLMMSVDETLARVHYCVYAGGSVTEVYFFALTCDYLTEASLAIADAAYDVRWFLLSSEVKRNEMGKDLSMVIMRSQRASSLTIGGFSPVTLQTFSSICNSAFSFLTLMRQSIKDTTG